VLALDPHHPGAVAEEGDFDAAVTVLPPEKGEPPLRRVLVHGGRRAQDGLDLDPRHAGPYPPVAGPERGKRLHPELQEGGEADEQAESHDER
jgi:hypothetical protein